MNIDPQHPSEILKLPFGYGIEKLHEACSGTNIGSSVAVDAFGHALRSRSEVLVIRRLCSCVLALLWGASTASALPIVVDQTTWSDSAFGQGILNAVGIYREVGQTFTVANTGTFVGLEVWLGAQADFYEGPVTAHLVFAPDGALPTDLGGALATVTLPVAWSGDVTIHRFEGFAVPVSAGDQLGVVLSAPFFRPPHGTAFMTVGAEANLEAHSMWVREIDGPSMAWSGTLNASDLMFRTYVDCASVDACVGAADPPPPPVGVPEPTSAATLVVGALWLAAARRTSRARRSRSTRYRGRASASGTV